MTCVRYAPWALLLFVLTGPLKASWISPVISESTTTTGRGYRRIRRCDGAGRPGSQWVGAGFYNGSNGGPTGW